MFLWRVASTCLAVGRPFGHTSLMDRDSVIRIPDEELWDVMCRLRINLVDFVRLRTRQRLQRLGMPDDAIQATEALLNPKALTIGFARRFATYKRATLMLQDPERLIGILCSDRPVQFIFAGKAHPSDEPGKRILQRIFNTCRDPEIGRLRAHG